MVPRKPFSPNIKCIIFALLVILVYSLSTKYCSWSYWVAAFLFVLSYVAMAYYDYLYQCQPKLKSGYLSVDSALKPEPTTGSFTVSLFHVLVLPVIAYASYVAYLKDPRGLYIFVMGIVGLGWVGHVIKLGKGTT